MPPRGRPRARAVGGQWLRRVRAPPDRALRGSAGANAERSKNEMPNASRAADKKKKPRTFWILGFFSGADGTRTRGLRRDRPEEGQKPHELVILGEACRSPEIGQLGTIPLQTMVSRAEAAERLRVAIQEALGRLDFPRVQLLSTYAEVASAVLPS